MNGIPAVVAAFASSFMARVLQIDVHILLDGRSRAAVLAVCV